MVPKKVIVSDLMQKNYIYFLTKSEGQNFDPLFNPELTPKQMLFMGIFGGKYMTDCSDEFPFDWFTGVKLCHESHDPKLNYFKVNASQSLSIWRANGWIHPDDPRGWFQWYCRYFHGRRHEDDGRQIKRWRAMTRHLSQLKTHFTPVRAQALLHWAYDSRKHQTSDKLF
ncbi:MAG: hypothetical protein WC069_04915 [Candidatus Shapirobacteria bacterium]